MYTSAIKARPQAKGPGRRRLLKTAGAYFAAAALALAFGRVYALFAHGVASPHMSLLFLYPLVLGALPFALLAALAPGAPRRRFWRPGANLYASGVAALASGSLLQGIFEIAGTASPYTALFFAAGAAFWATGLALMLVPRPAAGL